MCEKYGKENIIYEPGVTYAPYKNDNWWEENKPEIEKPVAAAAQADIIIACIGENSYCETPGNLTDLTLSENQRNLVKALAATGKPIVLVLNQGRPRIINDIEPLAKAVVNIMLPSNYGEMCIRDSPDTVPCRMAEVAVTSADPVTTELSASNGCVLMA